MSNLKFKSGWYVMELWQTGNVGPRNINAVKGQPENGHKDHSAALAWMVDNLNSYHNHFHTYSIMEIYTPVKL